MTGIPGNGRPRTASMPGMGAMPAMPPMPSTAPWIPGDIDPSVGPQMLPCQSWVQQVAGPDGTLAVVLMLATPAGLWTNVLPADFAKRLADNLARAAQGAAANLIIAEGHP